MEKITLKAARINAGLTLEEAAKLAKVSDRTISNYEGGRRKARIDILLRLAEAYGVTLDQLKLD